MPAVRLFSWMLYGVVLFGLGSKPAITPKMRALIIAVGDYPRTGGWAKLSSARDAALLEPALRTQGFNDIELLLDEAATYSGIQDALATLTRRARRGDIIYLHYSGHGQQIWDHEDSRLPARQIDETDGLDEALVPYDARDEFRTGIYEGERHLTDDELSQLLRALRQKIGPAGQLIFSVDACYSGSISRADGLLPVRGTNTVFAPADVEVQKEQQGATGAFSETFVLAKDAPLAELIVISAARSDQSNYEAMAPDGQPVGSLSLALSQNLMQLPSRQSTISSFFRQVEADMAKIAPYQSPQLEGPGDRLLFGSATRSSGGFPVLLVSSDRQVIVQGGSLAGLHPGTTVWVEQVTDSTLRIPGTVESSSLSQTTINLSGPLPSSNPADWRVRINKRIILFNPVHLSVALPDEALRQKVEARLESQERITLTGQHADLALSPGQQPGTIQLTDVHDQILGTYPATADGLDLMEQRLQKYSRSQYLRQFGTQAKNREEIITLQSIPVHIEQEGDRYTVQSRRPELLRTNRDVQRLPIGTTFIFAVTNRSTTPVYLSILAIDAADNIFLLFPDDNTPPAEYKIAADTTVYFGRPEHIFAVAEPRGKQIFLALATPEPIDLRPAFQQAPSGQVRITRGAGTPKTVALQELLFGESRAGSLPMEDAIICSSIIDIPD